MEFPTFGVKVFMWFIRSNVTFTGMVFVGEISGVFLLIISLLWRSLISSSWSITGGKKIEYYYPRLSVRPRQSSSRVFSLCHCKVSSLLDHSRWWPYNLSARQQWSNDLQVCVAWGIRAKIQQGALHSSLCVALAPRSGYKGLRPL